MAEVDKATHNLTLQWYMVSFSHMLKILILEMYIAVVGVSSPNDKSIWQFNFYSIVKLKKFNRGYNKS